MKTTHRKQVASKFAAALALISLALTGAGANAASEICFEPVRIGHEHSTQNRINYHVYLNKKEVWKSGGMWHEGMKCVSIEKIAPIGDKVWAKASVGSRFNNFVAEEKCPGVMWVEPTLERRIVFKVGGEQMYRSHGLASRAECSRYELNAGEFTPLTD